MVEEKSLCPMETAFPGESIQVWEFFGKSVVFLLSDLRNSSQSCPKKLVWSWAQIMPAKSGTQCSLKSLGYHIGLICRANEYLGRNAYLLESYLLLKITVTLEVDWFTCFLWSPAFILCPDAVYKESNNLYIKKKKTICTQTIKRFLVSSKEEWQSCHKFGKPHL